MIAQSGEIARIVHEELDSSNREAERLWRSGERGPIWIMARRQSEGRGRSGRPWVSERGNLFATHLWGFGGETSRAPLLGYVAALSVADTVGELAPGASVTLKWPNDCLLNDRKVAGILLESFGKNRGGQLGVAIGVGINLAATPDATETRWPATAVADAVGTAPEAEQALGLLANHMAVRLEQFRRDGFGPIRTQWEARAAHMDQQVTMEVGAAVISGTIRGLNEEGHLLLATASGMQAVSAGDVTAVRTMGDAAGN